MIDANAGRRLPSWILWAFAVLPLIGFWTTGLFDLDEGFYAAVVREMLNRGDFITPHYNGSPWFEKPILLYWLAAPTVALFGEMVGPRLPSVLCSLAVYAAVWNFGRRYLGELAGDIALLLVAGSLLFGVVGRLMMTDLPLVLFESLAFLCFWRSLTDGAKWRWIAAVCLGLSVLAKGPVGCAFFVLIAGITYWREPELRPGFRGGWLVGTMLFIAVVATWYVPAYLASGDVFVQKFLIEQNVGRFTGGDKAHTMHGIGAWIYYIPFLVLGSLPWVFSLFKAWPRGRAPEDAFLRFCARWAWVIFLFFSISAAKLPHYILPVIPPLALIVGAHAARVWHRRGHAELDWRVARVPFVSIVAVALITNLGTAWYYQGAPWAGKHLAAPHSEIHALTRFAVSKGQPIAVFQMPRRQVDRGTGGTKLQETSHPSVVFYAGKPVLSAETVDELTSIRDEKLVLTRTGRMNPSILQSIGEAGFSAEKVPTEFTAEFYEVWQLKPL